MNEKEDFNQKQLCRCRTLQSLYKFHFDALLHLYLQFKLAILFFNFEWKLNTSQSS